MTPNALLSMPHQKPREGERRRSNRIRHVIEAWIYSPTDFTRSQQEEVMSVNLSKHGVGFDIDHPIPTGSFWMIEIGMGDQRMISEMRIISCRKVDQRFEVGAEFC